MGWITAIKRDAASAEKTAPSHYPGLSFANPASPLHTQRHGMQEVAPWTI